MAVDISAGWSAQEGELNALDDFGKPPLPMVSDPNGTRFIERATNNLWLTFSGRVSMLICSVGLVIGGWVMTQVWQSYLHNQERVEQKLDRIGDQFTAMNEKLNKGALDMSLLKAQVDSLVESTGTHFTVTDGRVNKLEGDVERIKQQLYTIQQPYVSPEEQARKKWQK